MSFLTQLKSKDIKDIYKLICIMMSRTECEPFRVPVDWQGMGLIDYPEIVKSPMDLGTVKANIEGDKYLSVEDIAADVRLVWSNCMLYNSTGSEV